MYTYTRAHRKSIRIPNLLVIGLAVLAIGYFVAVNVSSRSQPIISPLADDRPVQKPASLIKIFAKDKTPESLGKALLTTVAGKWVNYSILVIDYNSDFEMAVNDRVIYTAASVNKIPILAALYWQVAKGEIDLDDTVTIQAKDVQDYGTGVIRYEKPGGSYSIKTLARLMMQKSDNTAAYVLAQYTVGIKTIQQLVDSWGLTQTDIENNKTSNRDMALLMKKIYNREITDTAHTQEMLAFFKDSDFEDRLPALLPDSAAVYHKIGTEVGTVHDVGIVQDGNLLYYIGIFTNDIRDEEQAAEQLAQVSKAVYDFMH